MNPQVSGPIRDHGVPAMTFDFRFTLPVDCSVADLRAFSDHMQEGVVALAEAWKTKNREASK